MKVVLENGSYSMRNMGDVAMLQVAAQRFTDIFPEAQLCIPTFAPELLPRYVCASAMDPRDWRGWRELRVLPFKYSWIAPGARSRLACLERTLTRRIPRAAVTLGRLWNRLRQRRTRISASAIRAITEADLTIACGGGYLTDEFPWHAHWILDTLELAQTARKPTALLGQGIGPVADGTLLDRMRQVLPRTNFIALREGRVGIALLQTLGVQDQRVVVTGDDAIEPAYNACPHELGTDLGVNLRVACYSGFSLQDACRLGTLLYRIARSRSAWLRPVPITWDDESNSDVCSLRSMLDEAAEEVVWHDEDTPMAVIRQVGKCRVVVTGSYHAAVFALAQGIPVVGVVRSQYYRNKLEGLVDQFGCGCRVLGLDSDSFEEELHTAVNHAWDLALDIRPSLLQAAERQIALSQAAYRQVASLMSDGVSRRQSNDTTRSSRRG
jgi:polysaccharide pyruvyl transferase WcaK-like protein